MKCFRRVLMAVALLVGMPVGAMPLDGMSDTELEAISGREGVIVGLELYYNAQKSADPLLDGSAIGGTSAAPDGNCVGLNNGCRLALQLSGREARNLDNTKIGGTNAAQSVQGEWLMIKDFYFALKMPSLYLDAAFMGSGTNAALTNTTHTGFFDVSRFEKPGTAGACLLSDGSASGTACTVANVRATPSLVMRHADSTTSYDTVGKKSAGYESISLGMKIGRMALEYDAGACTYAGGAACGYNQDVKGSFLGLQIRDNNTPFAGIAVGGKMYLYGF